MLKRFFSPATEPEPIDLDDVDATGLGRVVALAAVRAALGVAAILLAPTGLLVACRLDVVEG